MSFLEVNNISKVYGSGNNQVKALDKVSFSLNKGEFIAVVGASGSGKSTLMHILGGVDIPSSGSVRLSGIEMYQQNDEALAIFRRRQIGLIYQFYNLIPVLNVEENITLPLLLDGREPDPKYLNELIEMLGLSQRRRHLPNQLSGGQQQRVSIGRALMTRPALVLADEPTGNLDSRTSQEILELLRMSHSRFGQTLMIITHDMKIAMQAERVLVMEDGHLREGGASR